LERKQNGSQKDLKVCDNDTLVQILNFWTLSIILSLSKNTVLFIIQNTHNVSETGRRKKSGLQNVLLEDRDGIQCPKRCVLKNKQDGG
jgi:hypothetical protein